MFGDLWTENRGAPKTPNPTTTDLTPHLRPSDFRELAKASQHLRFAISFKIARILGGEKLLGSKNSCESFPASENHNRRDITTLGALSSAPRKKTLLFCGVLSLLFLNHQRKRNQRKVRATLTWEPPPELPKKSEKSPGATGPAAPKKSGKVSDNGITDGFVYRAGAQTPLNFREKFRVSPRTILKNVSDTQPQFWYPPLRFGSQHRIPKHLFGGGGFSGCTQLTLVLLPRDKTQGRKNHDSHRRDRI